MSWQQLEQAWHKAWKPPEKYTPSQWAERNFILPANGNAMPGRFKFAVTPYLRGIVDAFVEPGVEEVVFMKPTRVGGTTAGQIVLGYWIDNDPGPCLTVMPNEQAAEQEIKERIRPMLETSESLKRHVSPKPGDNTLAVIKLDTMTLYFGWSGSPQSLASNTCRYVRGDEIDKWEAYSGREADPKSLASERTATYLHRRRHYWTSTPTTRDGAIYVAFEGCGDRRSFHVPCPHCGTYQRLVFPQLKWPKLDISETIKRADEIERCRLAWYECGNPDCRGRIEESHKPKMLLRGLWLSEGQTVADGVVQGERQHSKRVGFHLSALYSPWRSFWEIAAKFIRAEGNVDATMHFRNSWLAEPFEVQVSAHEPSKIRNKSEAAKQLGHTGSVRIVPKWAIMLLATCDVQKDHVYWSVSAWGYEQQSKRVAVGISATLDEAYRQVFSPDVPFGSENGGPIHVQYLIIDSGYRKDEVTDFAKRDPTRVHIAKGLSTYFGPIAEQKIERASGVIVWNINTMQSKDTLDRLIKDPDDLKWQVYPDIGDEYCAQLSSERKTIDPKTKQMEWKLKTSGAANHWWDCEAMVCAVATALGAATPRVPESATTANESTVSSDWMNRMRAR